MSTSCYLSANRSDPVTCLILFNLLTRILVRHGLQRLGHGVTVEFSSARIYAVLSVDQILGLQLNCAYASDAIIELFFSMFLATDPYTFFLTRP